MLPGPRPDTATAWAAVIAGMPRQAPSAKLVCSGSRTASASGKVMYSAAVPKARFHWPFQVQTRSPTRPGATPLPTASMIPAASLCGMTRGNAILRVRPSRAFTSEGLTPDAAILTRTSPGPGEGVSTSPTRSTSRAAPFAS